MSSALATLGTVLAEIGWNPEIRNILSVLVGLGVLVGSVYLLVGSNTGLRSGALITLACLLGWMTTMGAIWWLYGIGLTGRVAAWHVEEINYSTDGYEDLSQASLEEARSLVGLDRVPAPQEIIEERPELVDEILPPGLEPEVREARAELITLGQILEVEPGIVEELELEENLGGWRLLGQSDRARGDAVATADAYLGPEGRGLFESSSEYAVRDAFTIGGRDQLGDPSILRRIVWKLEQSTISWRAPAQYAVVQVQKVVPECEEGQEPAPGVCYEVDVNAGVPTPELQEGAPVISVVLVRDLGIQRWPAILVTIISGILFAVTCSTLHRRDKAIAAVRGA